MKNVHQYLHTKTTKQVRLLLLGTKQSGITTLLHACNAFSSDPCFYEFKVANFGCQTWLTQKPDEEPKQNLHGMIVLLDASEPNEWISVQSIVAKHPAMPILFLLNKQDLCYRSTVPNKSTIISAFDLYEHKHLIQCSLISLKTAKEAVFPVMESFFQNSV